VYLHRAWQPAFWEWSNGIGMTFYMVVVREVSLGQSSEMVGILVDV